MEKHHFIACRVSLYESFEKQNQIAKGNRHGTESITGIFISKQSLKWILVPKISIFVPHNSIISNMKFLKILKTWDQVSFGFESNQLLIYGSSQRLFPKHNSENKNFIMSERISLLQFFFSKTVRRGRILTFFGMLQNSIVLNHSALFVDLGKINSRKINTWSISSFDLYPLEAVLDGQFY